MLSIGQVAKKLGIGVETIRFYEREGLLDEPQRRPSGYRQYDDNVLKRISFIRRSKELGFTLKEIKELFSIKNDLGVDCSEMKNRALKKINEIKRKIETLASMKNALEKITHACPGEGGLSDCSIVDYLEVEVPSNESLN